MVAVKSTRCYKVPSSLVTRRVNIVSMQRKLACFNRGECLFAEKYLPIKILYLSVASGVNV